MKGKREKLVTATLIGLLVLVLVFVALTGGLLLLDMPSLSAEFDCDDAVKFVYDRLAKWGISPTIVLGNLKKTGYSYSESDHIWLLVPVGPLDVALDWGRMSFGEKYYQGYSIAYEDLLFFVKQDFIREGLPAK